MNDVINRAVPGVRIVSTSKPEPALRSLNVVAVYSDADRARNAVLALESIESDDAAISLTVVAPPGNDQVSVDPNAIEPGVIDELTPRMLKGAVIGLVVGALLVGGLVAVFDSGIWIGGALGGALFGLVTGGIWGAFAWMGGSDAYRQSFVETTGPTITVVGLHTDDGEHAEEGRRRLAVESDGPPIVVRPEDGDLIVDS